MSALSAGPVAPSSDNGPFWCHNYNYPGGHGVRVRCEILDQILDEAPAAAPTKSEEADVVPYALLSTIVQSMIMRHNKFDGVVRSAPRENLTPSISMKIGPVERPACPRYNGTAAGPQNLPGKP